MVNPTDSLIALTQAFEQIGFCADSAEFRAEYEIELLKRNPHMGTLRQHQAAPSQEVMERVAKAMRAVDNGLQYPQSTINAKAAIAAMSQPVMGDDDLYSALVRFGFNNEEAKSKVDYLKELLKRNPHMGDASTRKDEDASNRSEATPKSPVSPSEISSLLPCPFCGSEARKEANQYDKRRVSCSNKKCTAYCTTFLPEDWNIRTTTPVSVSLVKFAISLCVWQNGVKSKDAPMVVWGRIGQAARHAYIDQAKEALDAAGVKYVD